MQKTNSVAGACAAVLILFFGAASAPVNFRSATDSELRVCADPNNLPFSNARGEGFENKLAELVARDLKKTLIYNWSAEREHFVKDTLGAQLCDVIMGVPKGLNALDITQPYYASSYVFVYRKDRPLDLHSIRDPRLKHLKIGVHLIGDDDTPPMQAFARQGIVANVSGFMIFGDYAKPNPPARLVEAVESGAVDVAALWGAIGGYFAKHSRVPLTVVPIADTDAFAPLVFRYEMGMGVRKGDRLKLALDRIIARHQADIRNLLASYGVPLATSGR